jgi:hypothetical protein
MNRTSGGLQGGHGDAGGARYRGTGYCWLQQVEEDDAGTLPTQQQRVVGQFFAIGALIGNAAWLYLIWLRAERMRICASRRDDRRGLARARGCRWLGTGSDRGIER